MIIKYYSCFQRHLKPEALQNAKQLAINLIQTIQSELQTYIQQQPPPVQPQQVIEQSQIPQGIYCSSSLIEKKSKKDCIIHECCMILFSIYSPIPNYEHWRFRSAKCSCNTTSR